MTKKQLKAINRRKSWDKKRNIRQNNKPKEARALWAVPHANRTYQLYDI